jgi:hypothetical protein
MQNDTAKKCKSAATEQDRLLLEEEIKRLRHENGALALILANNLISEKTKIQELELKVYHLQLPSLRVVMADFNATSGIRCDCVACNVSGRCEYDCHAADRHNACRFVPVWERMLQETGVTYNDASEDWPDVLHVYPGHGQHGNTPRHLYNVGRRDWVHAGWGRPLSSLDSPRKKVWDDLIEIAQQDGDAGVFDTP